MDLEWYETKVYKICYHNIHGKHTNEKRLLNFHSEVLAEREGFEPPVPCGTPVFKTGVFDHSTISPYK